MDSLLRLKWKSLAPIAIAVCFMGIYSVIYPQFISSYNINTLLTQFGSLAIAATGLTFVLLIGSIDLSVGSIISLAGLVFVALVNVYGPIAYFAALLLGLAAGALNGLVVTKLKTPSFLATLGTSGIFLTIAYSISHGVPLGISYGARSSLEPLMIDFFGVIPSIGVLSFAVCLLGWFVSMRLPLGRYVYAIGANERAARLSGVLVERYKIIAFMISGICSGMGGIIVATRLMNATARMGDTLLLPILAAVVVGGTALTGGSGGVHRTIIGTSIIAILTNAMNIVGVNVYFQQIVTGIVMVMAISMTFDRSKAREIK